jgi:hypothetical protein
LKISPPPLIHGEKGSHSPPSSGKEKNMPPSPPLLSTLSGGSLRGSQNKEPLDFLSRLLVQLPRRGEILARLSSIPLKERSHGLIILLTLVEKNISLDNKEWEELWSIMRKQSTPVPLKEGDSGKIPSPLSYGQGNQGEEVLIQDNHSGNLTFFSIHDGERRGQIALKREEGSDNLFIRMETETRHWEFHLTQPRKKGGKAILYVFTNDQRIINEPPPEWDNFCKEMIKKSINVEKDIKFLRKPLFLTENGSRELDHLVDIVL